LEFTAEVVRVFGLFALTGYFVVVGLLLLFQAPLEVILGVSVFLAVSTIGLIRGWPPRSPQPRFGRSGRQAGVIIREDRNPGKSLLSGRIEGH